MNNFSLLEEQAKALCGSESNAIANAANLSALMYKGLSEVNWVGFYFLESSIFENGKEELVLGPFQGEIACTRIGIGRGVCGSAFKSKQTLRVADVHEFDGHIACDAASESEIVVPFFSDRISGVLDVDSPIKARFGQSEQQFFENVAAIYLESISQLD